MIDKQYLSKCTPLILITQFGHISFND
uniref:Uncharacterized protein n=1 Tax=Anguilla anguilla TaxID=7936 RepID=A0A0E9T840_ANGAN